jgi:hypothetical protein
MVLDAPSGFELLQAVNTALKFAPLVGFAILLEALRGAPSQNRPWLALLTGGYLIGSLDLVVSHLGLGSELEQPLGIILSFASSLAFIAAAYVFGAELDLVEIPEGFWQVVRAYLKHPLTGWAFLAGAYQAVWQFVAKEAEAAKVADEISSFAGIMLVSAVFFLAAESRLMLILIVVAATTFAYPNAVFHSESTNQLLEFLRHAGAIAVASIGASLSSSRLRRPPSNRRRHDTSDHSRPSHRLRFSAGACGFGAAPEMEARAGTLSLIRRINSR